MKRDIRWGRVHHGFTPCACAGAALVGSGIFSCLGKHNLPGLPGARERDAHAASRTEPRVLWVWSSWFARMLK